jgi:hypothetical protein
VSRTLSASDLNRFYRLTDLKPGPVGTADGQTQGMRSTSNVPVFPEGEVTHPEYGDLDFSPKVLRQYVKNFDDRVRKIDLAVDIDHKNEKAVGWIKRLTYNPGDGVYAEVEWNRLGQAALSDRQYRYISPQFTSEYLDESSGETFKNVLIALTVTNFPFLKDMPAISLSERKRQPRMGRALAEYNRRDRRLFDRMTSTRQAAEHDQKCRLGCQRCATTNPRRSYA